MACPSDDPWPDDALQACAELAPLGLVLLDAERRITRINPTFTALAGRSADELIGLPLPEALQFATLDHFATTIERAVEMGSAETRVKCGPPQASRYLELTLTAPDPQRWVLCAIRDLSDLMKLSEELRRRIRRDPLTGLYTRDAFGAEMERALAAGHTIATMILDIDDFKVVNDTFGHSYGDQLLDAIAGRLKRLCHDERMVARLGGDEFAVLVVADDEGAHACDLAGRLCAALAEPFALGNRVVHTSCSLGVSVGNATSRAASDLIREADTAAYRAKSRGRSNWVLFSEDLRAEVAHRFEVESRLRTALAKDTMDAAVQGMFDAKTGSLVAVEALARLNRDDGEAIPAASFLDVAEHAGMLPSITMAVLERTLDALGDLLRSGSGPRLSINVSPHQLEHPDLVTDLERALISRDIDPYRLVAEITEREPLPTTRAARVALRDMRDVGISVGIDDFGAGSSSLSYVLDLPVAMVKLDRSLVRQLGSNSRAETILESLIELCSRLGLETVAEGVETETQLTVLRGLGCQSVQGYLLHRPCPIEQFLDSPVARESAQGATPPAGVSPSWPVSPSRQVR